MSDETLKMADVFAAFKEFTGLDWYPDPGKVAKNSLWKDATEQVDAIIAAQAKGKGVAHRTVEQRTQETLVAEAAELFECFGEWLVEVQRAAMV